MNSGQDAFVMSKLLSLLAAIFHSVIGSFPGRNRILFGDDDDLIAWWGTGTLRLRGNTIANLMCERSPTYPPAQEPFAMSLRSIASPLGDVRWGAPWLQIVVHCGIVLFVFLLGFDSFQSKIKVIRLKSTPYYQLSWQVSVRYACFCDINLLQNDDVTCKESSMLTTYEQTLLSGIPGVN